MGVVERGGGAGDLLPHVALHEAEQLGGEVEEVGHDGVHGNEIESQIRVGVGVVMGVDGGRIRGGALEVVGIVEVAQFIQLVVDLAHGAETLGGLVRGGSSEAHVLLRRGGGGRRGGEGRGGEGRGGEGRGEIGIMIIVNSYG